MFKKFPALQADGFQITSPATISYNCVAWAADDNSRWWEPDRFSVFFWPKGVPRAYTINAYVAAFAALGYQRCQNGALVHQQEKIAIYADTFGKPTHVAWQMADGNWSSKLGEGIDITHTTPAGLAGPCYGTASVYMKRPRRSRRCI